MTQEKSYKAHELTREEALAMLDRQAKKHLHMSGEEFVRAWNAGEIENPDRPEVMNVAMLLPLASDGRKDS